MSVAGADHVAPPFVDRLARIAVMKPLGSSASAIWWAVPSGPKDTHGSVARVASGSVEPAQVLHGIGATAVQVAPPSVERPVPRPFEPPSVQRSCCQTPTRLFGFVGLTATHGSTSALTKTSPGGGPPLWPSVHAAKGLGPETTTAGVTAPKA